MQPETAGSFTMVEIAPDWGDGALRLKVRYQPPEPAIRIMELVSLSASITTTDVSRAGLGRLLPTPDSPGHRQLGGRVREGWWEWRLSAGDAEQVERGRTPTAQEVLIGLEVRGIAVADGRTRGFAAETQLGIVASDWVDLLARWGDGTPASLTDLAGRSLTDAPSWAAARHRVAVARRHLSLGEDAQALSSIYRLFDEVARNPYKHAWDHLARPDLPLEKQEAMAGLLRATASALNKLGRHPGDEITADGRRAMLPLDHWEAELLVAVGQVLLVGVDRWRALAEQSRAVHDGADSTART